MKITHFLSIACGALAAALSLQAAAQDAPKKVLTRDELRACLDNQDKLKARADDVKARIKKLNEDVDAVKAEEDQLKAEQKRVEDSSFPGARDRFDRKVKQHTARAKVVEEDGKKVRADGEALTKDLDAHNANCANVAVKKEDKEAVDQEREAAGKK
jgi:hypothetical protein